MPPFSITMPVALDYYELHQLGVRAPDLHLLRPRDPRIPRGKLALRILNGAASMRRRSVLVTGVVLGSSGWRGIIEQHLFRDELATC